MERKGPAIGREGQVARFIQHDGVVVEQAVRQMSRAPFQSGPVGEAEGRGVDHDVLGLHAFLQQEGFEDLIGGARILIVGAFEHLALDADFLIRYSIAGMAC